MRSTFYNNVITIISNIPQGKVLTYGAVATLAGNPHGARTVSWILSSSTKKYKLPWFRVVNSKGEISFKNTDDLNEQKNLLLNEGIIFLNNKIPLPEYLWEISSIKDITTNAERNREYND